MYRAFILKASVFITGQPKVVHPTKPFTLSLLPAVGACWRGHLGDPDALVKIVGMVLPKDPAKAPIELEVAVSVEGFESVEAAVAYFGEGWAWDEVTPITEGGK